MTSVVYYKFKSQKEPSRVTFDGTGISVFDLKREILLANKLTTTADSFDLQVINPDTKEEYQDDSEVIPRSMSVLARRLPTSRPKDSAAKYVTGGPSISKKKDTGPIAPVSTGGCPASAPSGSEEDMISQMFQAQGEQWKQTQEHMANAAPVYHKKTYQAPAPDHPPPKGYLCHRCGQPGHWIQACPTNNDPNWEGKRVRRTTGIPRSMLRTISKPAEDDESNNTYMINEDGDYVVAVADNASWDEYQSRAKARMQKKDERPDDPELEDPLTHKLFEKPVKTPCCGKTYSDEAIQHELLKRDFVCPNCKTEEVLLDQLIPDTEMEERVRKYKEDRAPKPELKPEPKPEPKQEAQPEEKKRKREDDEEAEAEGEKKLKETKTEDGDGVKSDGEAKDKKDDEAEGQEKENSPSNNDNAQPQPNPGQWPMPMPGMPMPPMPFFPMPMFPMPGMPGMPGMPPGMPGMPMPPGMQMPQQFDRGQPPKRKPNKDEEVQKLY
uniref:ARAD1A04950p n=1 Tax=Blastobotrys adeninivorans TaxID=409370 RepID=A0A060SX09_BLAAD